jgi:hypothetical protein
MDIFAKINEIKDVELQALLSHSLRYSLQHSMIAAQAEAQKDNPNSANAVAIHKDTANLMKMLVEKVLDQLPVAPPPKAPTKKKA